MQHYDCWINGMSTHWITTSYDMSRCPGASSNLVLSTSKLRGVGGVRCAVSRVYDLRPPFLTSSPELRGTGNGRV